jgi:hypothetical protein
VREDFFHWWGPDICAYHENFSVKVSEVDQHASPGNNDSMIEAAGELRR